MVHQQPPAALSVSTERVYMTGLFLISQFQAARDWYYGVIDSDEIKLLWLLTLLPHVQAGGVLRESWTHHVWVIQLWWCKCQKTEDDCGDIPVVGVYFTAFFRHFGARSGRHQKEGDPLSWPPLTCKSWYQQRAGETPVDGYCPFRQKPICPASDLSKQ